MRIKTQLVKFIPIGILIVSGCGYTDRNNELIGQIKKIFHVTPLLCPDFDGVDVSLGVLRNGMGSISHEDNQIYLPEKSQVEFLRKANDSGALVKITYDKRRVAICVPERWATKVELVK